MSIVCWGKLVRSGGVDESLTIPSVVQLTDKECFFGRFSQPVKDPKYKHETQFVLPCLFVSSTHFSVLIDSSEAKPKYYIKDYSKNGTFLNDRLIGNEKMEIDEQSEISLKYKNTVKITYRFKKIEDNFEKPKAKQFVDHNNNNNNSENESIRSNLQQQSNQVKNDLLSESFAQQIVMFQEESKKQELRIASNISQIETLNKELDVSNKKIRNQEKTLDGNLKEISELKERISATEANYSAIEARNYKILEQLDEHRLEIKDLKIKNATLHDDLKHKSNQLESRQSLIDEVNKCLTIEKQARIESEKKLRLVHQKLSEAEAQNGRVSIANQALQDIIVENETVINNLKVFFFILYYIRKFIF
jgi:chromosome segregation ATPase